MVVEVLKLLGLLALFYAVPVGALIMWNNEDPKKW